MSEASVLPAADLIVARAREVVTCEAINGDPVGRIPSGAVAVAGDRILAVGTMVEVAAACDLSRARTVDAVGRLVAPGFVDCHTHLVFGGSRAQEYVATVTGRLAAFRERHEPTGILATVRMTRSEPFESLVSAAGHRLRRMFEHGTTTVESKSGYGLSVKDELKILEANRRLAHEQPIDVVSTFLGAHAVPPGTTSRRYTDLVVGEMVPIVAERGLAEFCDVYCDDGYFSVEESRRILEAGADEGLRAKIHADAYSAIGGSELAAELGAISVDHLNHTPPETMRALADRGVVGVVMPALDFAVAHPRPFDAQAMLAAGMTLALATDLCPGCWVESQQLVMMLAARLYGMSPEESLVAATIGGARALGLDSDRGSLQRGKLADLLILDATCLDDLVYRIGVNAVEAVIRRGVVYTVQPEAEQ